jgi:hypothetical protein
VEYCSLVRFDSMWVNMWGSGFEGRVSYEVEVGFLLRKEIRE